MTERGTYLRIAQDLRQSIRSGQLEPGEMLPSEAELAERCGVSRGTARAALGLLSDEMLVEVLPGKGRRVAGGSKQGRPGSAWERVAFHLHARLVAGDFDDGSPLPSEADLIESFGVSRSTVRRAYRYLADEGLVVVRHGAGAYPGPSLRRP